VASECLEEKHGLHVFEDHFIPEIIDPETGRVLPYGEIGELVFTTITKEAFPVIRTGRATSRASSSTRAPAGARTSGWSGSPAARTTCSSSAASTSSRRRSRRC
jgi:phenylacetate-CoA ligase